MGRNRGRRHPMRLAPLAKIPSAGIFICRGNESPAGPSARRLRRNDSVNLFFGAALRASVADLGSRSGPASWRQPLLDLDHIEPTPPDIVHLVHQGLDEVASQAANPSRLQRACGNCGNGAARVEWPAVVLYLDHDHVIAASKAHGNGMTVLIFVTVRDCIVQEFVKAKIEIIGDGLVDAMSGAELIDEIGDFRHFGDGVADGQGDPVAGPAHRLGHGSLSAWAALDRISLPALFAKISPSQAGGCDVERRAQGNCRCPATARGR